MTRNFRTEAISNALEAYKADGLTRTETIEYRGKSCNLEVVTLNPQVPLLQRGLRGSGRNGAKLRQIVTGS